MTGDLPEGTSLGTMQAPLSWVFSHTTRFLGAVKVSVQDGEGCILIRRGEVVAYYFRYGGIALRGNAAREYLTSQDLVDLTLCKYTDEEFASAAAWCRAEGVPVHDTPPPSPVSPLSSPSLSGEAGVRMVARCTEEDFTVLSGTCPEGLACADIAAALWEAEALVGALNAGTLSSFILEIPAGLLCAVADGNGILCILTDSSLPLGRVRSLIHESLSEG